MLNRTYKRLIACLCVGTLLFMQLAVAAYACPGFSGMAEKDGFSMTSEGMEHSSMDDCTQMDKKDSNLCRAYFHPTDQSDQIVKLTVYPAVMISSLTVVMPLVKPIDAEISRFPLILQRTTAPPPHVLFGVLRI